MKRHAAHDHWTIRESDLPPARLIKKHDALRDIEHNPVFRLLIWRHRSRPPVARFFHFLYGNYEFRIAAAVAISTLLLITILAAMSSPTWFRLSGFLAIPALAFVVLLAWHAWKSEANKKKWARNSLLESSFSSVSPYLFDDLLASPISADETAAGLWASATSRGTIRAASLVILCAIALASFAIWILEWGRIIPLSSFILYFLGAVLAMSRFWPGLALMRLAGRTALLRERWKKTNRRRGRTPRASLFEPLMPVLGASVYVLGVSVIFASARSVAAQVFVPMSSCLFGLFIGAIWGAFLQSKSEKYFQDAAEDLEFVLEKLRTDSEPNETKPPRAAAASRTLEAGA